MTTDADAKPNCEHVVAACGKAYPKRFRSGDGYSVLGEIGLLYNRLFTKNTHPCVAIQVGGGVRELGEFVGFVFNGRRKLG